MAGHALVAAVAVAMLAVLAGLSCCGLKRKLLDLARAVDTINSVGHDRVQHGIGDRCYGQRHHRVRADPEQPSSN